MVGDLREMQPNVALITVWSARDLQADNEQNWCVVCAGRSDAACPSTAAPLTWLLLLVWRTSPHSDPMVRISAGDHGKATTKHKSNTLNPKFNQVFSVPCEAGCVALTGCGACTAHVPHEPRVLPCGMVWGTLQRRADSPGGLGPQLHLQHAARPSHHQDRRLHVAQPCTLPPRSFGL